MTIDLISYPWSLFKQCYDANLLGDLSAELTKRLFFDESPAFSDLVGDSFRFYKQVSDEISVEDIEFEGKEAFREFTRAFIAESPKSDLDASSQNDSCVAVISPERLDHLAGLIPTFSVATWNAAILKYLEDEELVECDYLQETAKEFDDIGEYLTELCKFVSSNAGIGNCLVLRVC